MLRIRSDQRELLATIPREAFIKRMAVHLIEMRRNMGLKINAADRAPEVLKRLRKEMDRLLDNGFENESDIAAAIEYFELFDVEFNSDVTHETLAHQQYSVSEKLDTLWKLRKK